MESLSSYARQFLGQMEKPNVDDIEGLSPAISIDQKTTSKNPRSTVGTVTEIYDYLRLLYARIGIPHCPICGKEIVHQTIDQIVDKILEMPEKTKIQVLAPIIRGKKGKHVKEIEDARQNGFIRVRIDGILYDLSEEIDLEKNKKHDIDIVVDRLIVGKNIRSRLADSLEIVSKLSIPPFMLGLSWSTTERMSEQQAEILSSELAYYRRLLNPIILKIATTALRVNGYSDRPKIKWDVLNFNDQIQAAKTRLYNAQAEKIELENGREPQPVLVDLSEQVVAQ